MRRAGAHPDDDDLQLIERKRQALTAMLVKLKRLQNEARVTSSSDGHEPAIEDDEGRFDEITTTEDEADPENIPDAREHGKNLGVAEREILALPSNGNVQSPEMAQLEIGERIKQARRQISRLRDIIADISFQYSHVVQNAPRKSNRTAAQKRIKALHNNLAYNARIYSRCRSRLMTLHCDEDVLRTFRVLMREDLKASTEILRPNEQGSSSVKLSWIWRTGRYYLFRPGQDGDAEGDFNNSEVDAEVDAETDADPATLLECMSPLLFFFFF